MFGPAIALTLAAASVPAEPREPPRLLVFTRSYGFEHDVVKRPAPDEPALVERALAAWAPRGGFQAVVSRDTAEFSAERLATYAGVLLYTTGEIPLTPEQRAAFLAAIRGGLGFVGVHPATDTFYAWPEYGALVGAYFDGHPWHEMVRVRVADRAHPSTRPLGPAFEIVDEIYQFRAPYDRGRLRVLLELDADSVDLARPDVRRTDRDFALAWTREEGRGRVFYTALGHRAEVWADPRFRAHLVGGIGWALGTDAPPPALAPEDERLREHARLRPGDPRRGYDVFRRESGPMCARCHAVHGEGGDIGPDLSRLALERTPEEILEAVLAPGATIEPGFGATVFELDDGTLVTGRVRSETDARVVVVDPTASVRELDPRRIAGRRDSAASLMPEGLARTLTPEEFADLVAWLGTLKGS